MAVGDAYVFPGFLTLTLLFFPKPPTSFLTCFCRSERRKYAGKKSCLNRGSTSQPPGHESDTLTTEPPGQTMNQSAGRSNNGIKHFLCDDSQVFPCSLLYFPLALIWNRFSAKLQITSVLFKHKIIKEYGLI